MLRVLFVVFACVGAALSAAQPYVIDRFETRLTLSSKAVLEVEERIDVTFNASRRGIFRVIPVDYENGKGLTRRMLVDDVRVTDGQNALTTKVTFENGNIRIRIGDEDVYLSPGTKKTYVIRYRCRGMMNWFEKNEGWGPTAQLYWNVTGDQWDTHMAFLSATVEFPKVEGGKDLRAKVFYGPYGSTLNHMIETVGPTTFSASTQTTAQLSESKFVVERATEMPAYNGLTLVLDLPYNLIEKPGPVEAAWTLLSANLGLTLPIFVIPAIILLWYRHGRDPDGGPEVVQFDPPEGLSGPALGALIDERVDTRDISAGIFSLAVKGYLGIQPKEEGLFFKRRTADLHMLKEHSGPDLTAFESKLFTRLRACGTVVEDSDLRTKVAPYLGELKGALYEELVDKGYYLVNPNSARTRWFFGGLVVIVVLAIVATALTPYANPLPGVIGAFISTAVLAIGSQAMPKRTKKGAIAQMKAKGFAEFVRRARGDEIEWMAQKHPDASLFEALLPHAIALGLATEWATRFEGIVVQPPSWYYVGHGQSFRVTDFSRDVNLVSSSVGSAATTPPRSSGGSGGSSGFSSGGGFSGGGFGGGGGGSW